MGSTQVMHVGPYRLLNIVYTGQNSRTWQAYDDRNRRYVGLKTLFQSASRDRKQVQMLKWEYTVGTKLHNERIIDIFDFGWHNKSPYLAMEWFSAPNIKQILHKGYENYCVLLPKMIPQMLEALAVLHEAGWIHRDVKPDNFLFSEEKGVKLIDFALCKPIKVSPLAKLLKFKSVPQGTPSYMSPEQILGAPLDGRSDIYSLGCSFFEMLASRPTFTGESMNDLLSKHISASTPMIRARNKFVTEEFSALLSQMMAKRPQDRPKSMRDLVMAMRSIRIFTRPPQLGDRIA